MIHVGCTQIFVFYGGGGRGRKGEYDGINKLDNIYMYRNVNKFLLIMNNKRIRGNEGQWEKKNSKHN